jgi:hypothetical protein
MLGFRVAGSEFVTAFRFPSVSTVLVGLEWSGGMDPPSSSHLCLESLTDSSNSCELMVILQNPQSNRHYRQTFRADLMPRTRPDDAMLFQQVIARLAQQF